MQWELLRRSLSTKISYWTFLHWENKQIKQINLNYELLIWNGVRRQKIEKKNGNRRRRKERKRGEGREKGVEGREEGKRGASKLFIPAVKTQIHRSIKKELSGGK